MRTHLKLIFTFVFYILILILICWGTDWAIAWLKAKGMKLDFDAARVSQLLASTLTLWVAFRQRIRQPPVIFIRTQSTNGWDFELLLTVNCEQSSSVAIHDVEIADFERLSPVLSDPIKISTGDIKQIALSFRANNTARERLQKKWLLSVLVQVEKLDRAKLKSKCVRMRNPLRKGVIS